VEAVKASAGVGGIMNNDIILDVDVLDYLPAKTILKFVEHSQMITKALAGFKRTIAEQKELFRALEELDIDLQFIPDGDYMALLFTGDGERLSNVWKALRRNGYKTTQHPKKGDTTFYAFWYREGYSNLFMNFSSSLCKRVQVGTRMVEQPIYETQCGELPELETDTPPPPAVVVTEANDIPF
jgi:hypothetical protein